MQHVLPCVQAERCLLLTRAPCSQQEYVEMLAAGEEGKWKEFLPSMGTEAHIPKLFKSSSKVRCPSQQSHAYQ